ncbi:hypothetical protein [Sphingobium nicotianae]|uniref:Lipoprotein n=1 Tax=Sphingobium nicotianae TaxID=2782607 RepID=A0A9X1AIG5_9SPHN|nr:hypothetical protein [Sphingobium nicotianae]MBT2185922.1 hypothetical protein [Sphingobium nicotianae]
MRVIRRTILILAMCASPALADPPDLSGFWTLEPGPPKAGDPAMIAKLPPNTVVLADTGITEFPTGEYGGLKPKPEALAKAKQWKPQDEMTLSRVCAAPSLIYAIQGPFPFELYQTKELIVFKYEYFDQVRIVFMDGRKHPPEDAPHSRTGHSIGHWEGDELVIDTTHFEPATITNNGLDHDDKIHMVERYKLTPDGKTLMATQWFEDKDVLDNNGARFIQWKKKPGEYVFPYDCDPSLATQYQETKTLDGK